MTKTLIALGLTLTFAGTVPVVPVEQAWEQSYEVPVFDASPKTPGDFPEGYYHDQSTPELPAFAYRVGNDYLISHTRPDGIETHEIGKAYIDRCTNGLTHENKKSTQQKYKARKEGVKPDCSTFTTLLFAGLALAQPTIVASSLSGDNAPGNTSSNSIAYDSQAAGTNRLLVYIFSSPSGGPPTSATYNGVSLTVANFTAVQYHTAYGYLIAPATGSNTFVINYPSQIRPLYRLLVLQDVNQTSPFDTSCTSNGSGVTSVTCNITTTVVNDAVLTWLMTGSTSSGINPGGGASEQWETQPYGAGNERWDGAYNTQASAGTHTGSFSWTTGTSAQHGVIAFKHQAPNVAPSIESDLIRFE